MVHQGWDDRMLGRSEGAQDSELFFFLVIFTRCLLLESYMEFLQGTE